MATKVNLLTPAEDVQGLFRDKLDESGITEQEAAYAGITYHTGDETVAMHRAFWPQHTIPAMRIPYWHPLTDAPLAASHKWPQHYRMRALRMIAEKNFAKYLQVPGSGSCAYFPRVEGFDWQELCDDVDRHVYITEGELKALKATIEGIPTIGLGGVNSLGVRDLGHAWLPELDAVQWVGRVAYIVYDSDIVSNPNVCRAAQQLAEKLVSRGAKPFVIVIRSEGSAKMGLDDYLVAHGVSAFDRNLVASAQPLGTARALFDVNRRYAMLQDGDKEVVDMLSGKRMKATAISTRYNGTYIERRMVNGVVTDEPLDVGSAWMRWPLRNSVEALTFDPSLEPMAMVESKCGQSQFNTWRNFMVEPKKGSVKPFTDLVNHLFKGAEPEAKEWFLDWLAYPLQNPGAKLASAVLFHGIIQGSGKTMVAETMGRIYGDAYTKIGQDDLSGDFNPWAASRCFILADDMTGIDRREVYDKLKVKVTQVRQWINIKGVSQYELDDHANWFFTSNRANVFFLDRGDRRFFIHEVAESSGRLDETFYTDYMAWLDAEGGGAGALLHYFQSRDLGSFNPSGDAYATDAKRRMRENAQSAVGLWADKLIEEADSVLVNGSIPMEGDLFTSYQLCQAYGRSSGSDVSHDAGLPSRLANALSQCGIRQVNGQRPVRVNDTLNRYYAVRNREKWEGASVKDIQKHLEGRFDMPSIIAAEAGGRGAKGIVKKSKRY